MNIKKENLCILLVLVFHFSCSKKKDEEKTENTNNISPISIKIELDKIQQATFSTLFESIEYVFLESNDSVPLVGNMKTLIKNDFIYIEDNELNNLHKFNLRGELKTIFKSTGDGPGQFRQIEDFQIKGDTVLIYDRVLGKILFFNLEGKFLRENLEKNGATNFHVGNNFTLLFFSGYSNSDGNIFMRKSDNLIRESFFKLPEKSNQGGVRLLHGFVSNEKTKEVSITIPYTYQIATLDSLGYLKNLKKFDFLKIPQPNPGETYYQPEKINVYFPFHNFYWVSQFFNRKGYHFMVNENNEVEFSAKNLVNDIDGINFFFYPISKTENQLVFYSHSTFIYDLYQRSKNRITEKSPKTNIHEFIKKHDEELTDDRHVMIFLNFKNRLIDN
ncbi:6-bladed beta-propeller [Algoriphagus marinus]|uniref:6-bladed beta-propeller n=1 Tax=Algoriphagus marinus TaxID=1925762 RepID=UPI00094BA6F7|nr:6-bladed beta-propeller [Algoriphagus marinus]